MPGQHDNATKEQRSRRAIQVAREMSQKYRENMIGKTYPVLFEEPSGDYYTGHCTNYVKVYVKDKDLHNQICPVTVTGLHGDGVMGILEKI